MVISYVVSYYTSEEFGVVYVLRYFLLVFLLE